MEKIHVALLFGGVSAEHDVSIITALQVIEKIDQTLFTPHCIYLSQDGKWLYYQRLTRKSDFKNINPVEVFFSSDRKGVYFATHQILKKKIYITSAYLAFHGGNGESGQVQGLLETLELAHTSSGVEGSTITMNKAVTKEILSSHGIQVIPGTVVKSEVIQKDITVVVKNVLKTLSLPVIIKPAHLGSSIGIHSAKSSVEMAQKLMEASFIDSEIVIERLMDNFHEYNCAVRLVNNILETSEVEEPLTEDEILSFADKYQRGYGKKNGFGMASLNRKLPANIPVRLKKQIQDTAKTVFELCRCKGMARIDMIYHKKQLYVVEVNSIPGSMSYYLWEASGVSFTQQITDLIRQSIINDKIRKSRKLVYKSDIVDKFISQ